MRALVAGWFSWEKYAATAGDLMACDVACEWLREAGLPFDVACAPPFPDGVDWRIVDSSAYTHLVFVCGPFRNIGPAITDFLDRFAHCFRVGLDVAMIRPVEEWNPFDLLIERQSNRTDRPDISLACRQPTVPVVGICLVHPQKEYGDSGRHPQAGEAIRRLLAAREVAAVPIDTRLDENSTGLRTRREVESLIGRMNVLITTRLHGTVLALKNGVPALAIDPISGGGKVKRQADVLGWPVVFTADTLDDAALLRAFDYCLTDEARAKARACAEQGARGVEAIREQFVSAIRASLRQASGG
jgi:Polysaccharide pyruvyl transferase